MVSNTNTVKQYTIGRACTERDHGLSRRTHIVGNEKLILRFQVEGFHWRCCFGASFPPTKPVASR